METNSVGLPRSFFSRHLKLFVGLGLLALTAGGAGVYWFTAGRGTTATTPAVAHRAHSATDELKNLFAEQEQSAEDSSEANALFGSDVSSTTSEQTLPPESTPKPEPTQLAHDPAKSVGDRYANWSIAPALPPIEQEPEPAEESQLSEPEVTRGQDPEVNPLRASGQRIQQTAAVEESQQDDARAAFSETASQDRYATASPLPGGAPHASTQQGADPTATALEQAEPLSPAPAAQAPAANPFAGRPFGANLPNAQPPSANSPGITQMPAASELSNSGYAPAGTATPTTVPPAAPTRPPVVDLGVSNANLPAREPTPAFPIEQNQLPASVPPQLARIGPTTGGVTKTPGIASTPGTGRPGERLLEGAQSPAITIQKLAPTEIQVGKRCVFAIRVQNSGQRTAQQVQIRDEIPAGTELIGTAPKATVSGSKVVWDLGTLSVGEERTVEMELLPTEEGELGSVATVTLAAQASAKARCTKPELSLRLTTSPQVHVGDQQLVQIEVSNPGTGAATGVMLLENVPAGVSHEAGPALEFEVGRLEPGESRRLDLILTAEQAGRITNTMSARADAGLNVQASCDFEIIAPDLRLSVEGPDRRFLERPATYQVSIDNPGTAPAKEVQLVTHLPKGLQFVSANNLGEYDAGAHSVYWSLAELPANERGTVELVALPVEAGQHVLQISTKARDGLSDETQKEVLVEGIAALNFEVVDLDDPIEVGGETTYEIRVVNQGSKAAANVQLVATMSPGLRALSARGDTRNAIQGDRVMFAPLPQLGPKAESTFRIQAQGVQSGDQRITVQITTDEIREPITKEESTRVYSDR